MDTKYPVYTADVAIEFVCPNCGQVHNTEDYASLPAACQLAFVTVDLGKFDKPTE